MKLPRNTNFALLLFSLLAAAVSWPARQAGAANITWTNAAGDLLWSTALNWDSNAVPGTSDTALFTDTTGWTNAAGAVNNIVSANKTVVALRYVGSISNASQAHFHTTRINPGITLTADSAAPSFLTEIASSYPGSATGIQLTYNTIIGTGGATLAVGNLASPSFNAAGNGPDLWVVSDSNDANAQAVLDMSQLDNFTFAGSYAVIGCQSSSVLHNGVLMLARTNFIKTLQPYSAASFAGFCVASARSASANSFDVGDVQLGLTNTIWTDLFAVGCSRRATQGTVEFQSSLLGSSPSLFMRGTTGANRMTKMIIGDISDNTASNAGDGPGTGIVDFTGGTVDILVATLNVGRGCNASASSTRKGSGNGTLTFTAGTIDATTLNIGAQNANNFASGTGVVNVRSNALLRVAGGSIGIDLGANGGTGNGTLNIAYGGQVIMTNAFTDGTSGTSAINVVTNGTLHIGSSVTVDTLNLDGGKLHFVSGNSADISGTSLLSFGPGGATIDTDNNTVTLASPIGNSGSGGLTKIGSGKLILGADNPYSGPTVVSNGTLRISNPSGSATGSGSVTLTATGTLEGAGSIAGVVSVKGTLSPGTSPGTITLGSAIFDGATLNMELAGTTNIGVGVNDLIAVTGALTLTNHTTVVVSPLASLSTSGPYTLMQYGSLPYGYASNLTITCSSPRYGFTVLDPALTAPYVQMNVSSTLAGVPLWHGGAIGNPAVWDIFTSTNWFIAGSPDKFANGDPVAFDDTALTNKVTLVGALTPASISMSNNTVAYGLGGTGSIAAGGALAMYGSGSLTLSNSASDNFTGGIDLEAGSLTLANPVGPSSLGSVTLNGSSLLTIANNAANTISGIALSSSAVAAFSQPTNVTLSAPLTGGGTLVKQGTNMLTLSANNSSFSGAMQVNGGVLRVGASQALNGSGVAVANTATLDVNGIATSTNVLVTVQGNGVGGRGALDNGSSTAQPQALDNIALAADTTIGATGARWDTLSTDAGNGSSFAGNNFKLTKVGTNDFWLGVSGDTGLGDVAINEGLMGFEQGNLGNCTLGDITKTITVRTNATLGFWQPNVAGDKQVALQDRASLMGGSAGVAEFGGSVSKLTLNGTNRVWFALGGGTANPRAGGNLQCDSEITGGGVLTVDRQLFGAVASVGTFTLAGSNTFTSPVIVNDGALRLANNLALNTNGTVVVKTNGVSGVGTGGTSPKVPHVEFSGGVTIPPGVTIHMNSASSNLVGTLDMRTALVVPNADVNEFQGTLIPHGDGNILITGAAAGSYLTLSGPITNTAFALPAGLAFNGAGSGTISGQVNINGEMEMNIGASATWTYSGAGNHYAFLAIETGTTALGADNGLSTTDPVQMILSGTLDLAGFSQTVPSLTNTSTAKIGNSSTTSDSVLTINGPAIVSVIAGPIRDALGAGSKTVALTITNSKVQLNNAFNIYTGPTLVQNLGTLGGNGTLASAVTVQSGGTLSPGASIGTLTINNTLTLSSGSTSFFEIDAGAPANDMVAGLTSVSYAGTLVISNTSVTPFAAGNSFQLFSAGAYSGAFDAIVPATPGAGLVWDTSTLASDGTLRVASSGAAITASLTGSTLSLSWSASFLGWFAQSNSVSLAIPTNWHDIPGSQTGTNLSITIVPTQPKLFFRLRSP